MIIIRLRIALFLFLPMAVFSQNDTIMSGDKMSDVVITGQYNPQSVKKSVFQVKVISRADIDRQAGNNLADVLNQTLNLSVTPNASTGKSGVSLFGLDASYFKILVDNVPLINDEGLGNYTDLTQINLDDIQQIEIVEGSMGVDYGANAVSGIINIITKKSSAYKWEITPYLQEETIGKEYNGVDKGRHIQSLRIGHNFNEKWYAYGIVTANDFDGFLDRKKGRDWLENDGRRGYEWLPKQQLTTKAFLSFSPNASHRFFYRFEYFDETTKRYSSVVDPQENPATGTTNPLAGDEIFTSERFFNLLNGAGRFENGLTYDVSASFQQQKRNYEFFRYLIRTGEKFDIRESEYESRKVYYSKGNLSNFLYGEAIDFQVGYEVNTIDGYAAAEAGLFAESIERNLGSYDFYASSEINVTPKFSLRPGARSLFSSKFATEVALSLSAKYDLGKGYELRGIFGTCPRMPDFEELYSYFVDVNHDVRGNPDLTAEHGFSTFLHLNKNFVSKKGLSFNTKFTSWFMNISDRIELIIINPAPLRYQYSNIDEFRTWGTSLTSGVTTGNWNLNAGFTFSGVSKVIDNQAELADDDYLYSVLANGNIAYTIPKWKTVFSAFVKYNGPQYQFVVQTDADGNQVQTRGKQDDFTWLDATVRKSFANEKLEVTLGARNLTNIKNINTTATEGGAHNGPPTALLMGYGRSYFLKILYKFNFG